MRRKSKVENNGPLMITDVRVNGFRSLQDFSIAIRPGLNVLVGPNGAGKTNIIEFFEFLTNTIRRGLPSAVSAAGGAARVFSKESMSRDATVSWEIRGTAVHSSSRAKNKLRAKYFYAAKYKFLPEASLLFLESEEIRLMKPSKRRDLNYEPASLLVSYRIERSESDPDRPRVWMSQGSTKGDADTERDISRRFAFEDEDPHLGIFSQKYLAAHHDWLGDVETDLTAGISLNVSPAVAKQPSDIALQPQIENDGSGLVATLAQLKRLKKSGWLSANRVRYLREIPSAEREALFEKVTQLLGLVNPAIREIDVKPDLASGRLVGILSTAVHEEDDKDLLSLPFAAVSDGTIKWLTLTTALLAGTRVVGIEEPENFLHPEAQRRFISLVRDLFSDRPEPSFIFLSTHSESILNACRPEELVLVAFDNSTRVRRPNNVEKISEEIRNSGFGLGYFYSANAIE